MLTGATSELTSTASGLALVLVVMHEPSMRYAAARALASAALGLLAGRQWPTLWVPALVLGGAAVILAVSIERRLLYVALACVTLLYGRIRLAEITPLPVGDWFEGVVVSDPLGSEPAMVTVELGWGLGRVLVRPPEGEPRLRYGDAVRVYSQIRPFDMPRNPGLSDRNAVMSGRGYVGTARPGSGLICVTGRNRGSLLMRLLVMPMRRYLVRTIDHFLPGDEGGLLAGLLLGGRARLSSQLQEAFTDAGIVHVLAVSGMNISVVIAAVWMLLSVLRVRGWWQFCASAIVTTLYLAMVGWSGAPARAGVMAMLVLLSMPTQRRVTPTAGLCCAGLAVLLWDPWLLFDAGTQLSFAATLAIVLVGPWVADLFSRRGIVGPLRSFVLMPLAVSVAAGLGTAPLLLHHFHRIQPLGFITSWLVAVPVAIAMPLALVAMLVNLVSSTLAGLLFESLRLLLGLVLLIARWGAELGPGVWEPGKLAWPWVFWLYGMGLLLACQGNRWANSAFRVVLSAGLALAAWLLALQPREMRLTFLDPGEGDALLIEDTLGQRVLVDAGRDGPGVLRDYLRVRGINRLDVVVVTHPDRDHYGGLIELGRRCRIGMLLVASRRGEDGCYDTLLTRLEANGTKVVVAGRGDSMTGLGFSLRFLTPDPVTRMQYEQRLVSTNVVSLAAQVAYRGYTMLLAGDLDEPAVFAELGISAWLLKSPHHGSRKGNTPQLYGVVRPEQVVVMGRFPTPAGLEERFRSAPPVYTNTRRDGGCILRFPGGEPRWQRFFSALPE